MYKKSRPRVAIIGLPDLMLITWLFRNALTNFSHVCKVAKVTIGFVMPFYPFVRPHRTLSHWTDFHLIWYLSNFRKSVPEIEVSLKSDKKAGILHEYRYTFVTILTYSMVQSP